MPVIGEFHSKFWRARANAPAAAGTHTTWMYPAWQSSVIVGSFAVWAAVRPVWDQVRWLWRVAVSLWWCRQPACQAELEAWIAQQQRGGDRLLTRVQAVRAHEAWPAAQAAVRDCAMTPKFHSADQWVAYSRAIKANTGQAQNVFRHLKVVQTLQAAYPTLSNPDAHLLAELAYQDMVAAPPRRPRVVIDHPKRIIPHQVLH